MEKQSEEGKQKELDREASQNEQIRETGQAVDRKSTRLNSSHSV